MTCLNNYYQIVIIIILVFAFYTIYDFLFKENFGVILRRRSPRYYQRYRGYPYYNWYWYDYLSPKLWWSWYWKRPYDYSQVRPIVAS